MLELLTRWPAWYVVLAAYCIYLGVDALRRFQMVSASLKSTAAQASTPRERGERAGYRAGLLAPALAWTAGGLALLTGAAWVRALLALGFLLSTRSVFKEYATGFAAGRKAAELAAAPEYVVGRIKPKEADYAVAAVYVAITRLVPFVATLYAMWTL